MATYSFLDVVATLVGAGGIIDLGSGSAVAQEGITVVATGDKNQMTIGADGEGMHSLRGDKSGTVTVRLLKTSPQNAKLMALYNFQSVSSALWGQNIITIQHTAAKDTTACRSCAFAKVPDLNYKTDGDMVEWSFHAIKIDKILGTYSQA